MSNTESEVRQMLERRAADIEHTDTDTALPAVDANGWAPRHSDTALPNGRLLLGTRLLLSAAAIAVVALVGAAAIRGLSSDVAIDASGEAVDDEDTGPPTTDELAPTLAETSSVEPVPGTGPDLAEVLARLPPGVDVHDGPAIELDLDAHGREFAEDVLQGNVAPARIAGAYLVERLAGTGMSHEWTEVAQDGELTYVRWTADDGELAGSVIVRDGPDMPAPGIVLATTDGVEIVSVERSLDEITIEVADTGGVGFELIGSVTSLQGEQLGEVERAGAGRLSFSREVDWRAVAARVDTDVDGLQMITEFAIAPSGFESECGTAPPVTIDVGNLLGDLQEGPAPQSGTLPLDNQRVWHYPGDIASVEILWPADPALAGRIDPVRFAQPTGEQTEIHTASMGGETFSGEIEPERQREETSAHVLGLIGPSLDEPCSLAQVSVHGARMAVDWWAQAISPQWSWGWDISIADLDPEVPPSAEETNPDEMELIVKSEEASASEIPQIPEQGSCDGLPDAPPRTGTGNGVTSAKPEEALDEFLHSWDHDADGPGPAWAGYTELIIDESHRAYV